MKYFLILILLTACFVRSAMAQQIKIECRAEVKQNIYSDPTIEFYAVKDEQNSQPQGTILFTPDGTSGWDCSIVHQNVPVSVDFGSDSSELKTTFTASGRYDLTAIRGNQTIRNSLIIFYVHIPPFQLSLIDPENCQLIHIGINNFHPALYEGNYPGSKDINYFVGREVNGSLSYRGPIPLPEYTPQLAETVNNPDRPNNYEDANYYIKIGDRFGLEWISEKVAYTSVIPKVQAKLELLNTVDIVGQVNEPMGQAPLEVAYYNESKNATAYEWFLYRDTAEITTATIDILDSLIDNRIRTENEFTYTYPNTGRYKVLFIAINGGLNRCRDTSKVMYVNVVESLLEVPNVFTPNGDGKNDLFRVKALSLAEFKAVVLNRWGRKVSEWNNPTEGWDGRINGKYATPGTYYYIITARGREKNNPPQYVKKGALMLIR